MRSRLDFHKELVKVLGSNQVYFQPPESVRMRYPCIVYERDNVDTDPADDMKYLKHVRYEVMYISKDPDTNDKIADILDSFRFTTYVRHFVSDNINHEVFTIYY